MSVDGSVASRARQVLVLPVGDVLVRPGVAVLLGQAEVNDVDQVALFAETHQKVVGLHVSVDEVLGVDVFNSADLKKIGFNRINTGAFKVIECKKLLFMKQTRRLREAG